MRVDLLESTEMVKTFRLKKSVKYQGMGFSAFFLAVLVAYSSLFFLEDPAKHGFKGENAVARVGGMGIVVFGTMFLMSVYMWVAYYVERFTISETSLTIRSMLQNDEFDVSGLECLIWRFSPRSGRILFRHNGTQSRLDLSGYAINDRIQIITILRDLVPTARQEGWPTFCHKVALPLTEGRLSFVSRVPESERITVTRGRYDRIAAISFPLSICVAIALWLWLGLWQLLVLPLLVIVAWILLRFNVSAEGRISVRLTSTPRGRAQLILSSAAVGMLLLARGLPLLGVAEWTAHLIGLGLLGACSLPILFLLRKANKEWRIADEEGFESAQERWLQWKADEAGGEA